MKHFAFFVMILMLCCCTEEIDVNAQPAQTPETGRTLIAYYSYTGHCSQIAATLADFIDADVVEVQTVAENQDYNANNYQLGRDLLNIINADPENLDSYPAIKPVNKDVDEYDNIIFITPLWHAQMAAPAQTYLFQNRAKLAGKHFGLIVSSHSSGISTVVNNAHRLVPDAEWMGESLWINNSQHPNRATLIENWLETLDFAVNEVPVTDKLYLTIDGNTKVMTLVDNVATRELVAALANADITATVNDNNFELWGDLGRTFTTSNEYMTCVAGDVVLYSSRYICLFYGSNSYSYTRLGRIEYQSLDELKNFLKAGQNNVQVTLSLNAPTAQAGDADGNGHINMDDLTALINYLLDDNSAINPQGANVDGVEGIGMDDLTALINIMLNETPSHVY